MSKNVYHEFEMITQIANKFHRAQSTASYEIHFKLIFSLDRHTFGFKKSTSILQIP